MRKDFEIVSFNEMRLDAHLWYSENISPKCLVIISHGMAEAIMRYERFAEFLVENHIFVYGHSHRGHGEIAGASGRLGYIGEDGWNRMIEDLNAMVDLAEKEYPKCKKIVYGHSMGSYVARGFLIKYPYACDAIVFSGTGYPDKIELIGAKVVAGLEAFFNKSDKPSKRLDKLSFGKFNAQIDQPKTSFDWLSRDLDEVKAYIDNPLCGNIHPTSFFVKFIDGLLAILYPKQITFEPPFIPVLVLSGEKDPCGAMCVGVTKTINYYKGKGFEVESLIYPEARHEMLNEINKLDVYQDVLNWIHKYTNK